MYLHLTWVKVIDGKLIEFGNINTFETKQKVDLSLWIKTYKERYRAYAIDVIECNIDLSID